MGAERLVINLGVPGKAPAWLGTYQAMTPPPSTRTVDPVAKGVIIK